MLVYSPARSQDGRMPSISSKVQIAPTNAPGCRSIVRVIGGRAESQNMLTCYILLCFVQVALCWSFTTLAVIPMSRASIVSAK